jgi:hypothetical protein
VSVSHGESEGERVRLEFHVKIVGPEPPESWRSRSEYCFTHAVARALRGEQLKLVAEEGYHNDWCEDCRSEKERADDR